MRRIVRGLAISAFTFVVGVSTSLMINNVGEAILKRIPADAWLSTLRNEPAPPPKRARTMVAGMAGEGISADGYPTSFSNHEYSDGTSIHQLSVFYKSPRRANAEMQKRLKDAVEIIRREPELDETGAQVGERAVATFAPYKGSSAVWAELLWTDGSRYVLQRRSSLQSILDDLDSGR